MRCGAARDARRMKRSLLVALALLAVAGSPLRAASVITSRPDDAAAVSVTPSEFGVRGEGTTDDTDALQAAIDKAVEKTNGSGGVVFLPAGRYRLTRTLF